MPFLMRMKSKHEPAGAQGSRSAQPLGGTIAPSMDRRREARCRADRKQAVSAQLIGGVDVRLCNVSKRGVMFESSMRVLVGARVTLRLRTAERSLTLPGEVVRSRVSATHHGRLRYETAVALASDCPIDNDDLMLRPSTEVVSVIEPEVVDAEVIAPVTLVNEW
jgi:hypothetical protein